MLSQRGPHETIMCLSSAEYSCLNTWLNTFLRKNVCRLECSLLVILVPVTEKSPKSSSDQWHWPSVSSNQQDYCPHCLRIWGHIWSVCHLFKNFKNAFQLSPSVSSLSCPFKQILYFRSAAWQPPNPATSPPCFSQPVALLLPASNHVFSTFPLPGAVTSLIKNS